MPQEQINDIRNIIAPMYLLHDLRIYFDHLLPEDKQNEKRENIVKTLEVKSFEHLEEIYMLLIDKLDKLFQYLVICSK